MMRQLLTPRDGASGCVGDGNVGSCYLGEFPDIREAIGKIVACTGMYADETFVGITLAEQFFLVGVIGIVYDGTAVGKQGYFFFDFVAAPVKSVVMFTGYHRQNTDVGTYHLFKSRHLVFHRDSGFDDGDAGFGVELPQRQGDAHLRVV